jgi:hypothetical protein
MGLEDVLKSGGNYLSFQGEDISEEIKYNEVYERVLGYLQNTRNPDDIPTNPSREYIAAASKGIRKETESELIKSVKENYDSVVDSLGEREVVSFIQKYDLPKELGSLAASIEAGDINSLRKTYNKSIEKDKLLASTSRYLSDSDIDGMMRRRLNRQMTNFIIKKTASVKEKTIEYDSSKAIDAVREIVSKMDDKNKNDAYLYLGRVYFEMEAEKAKKKGKEKK